MVSTPKHAPTSFPVSLSRFRLPPARAAVRSRSRSTTSTTTTSSRLRGAVTTFHGTAGVAALLGGAKLVMQPSGAGFGLTTSDLLGFASYLVPGILLCVLGLVQLAAAAWTMSPGALPLQGSRWAAALLVVFVGAQTAMVKPWIGMAVVLGIVGWVVFTLSNELYRDEPHAPILP